MTKISRDPTAALNFVTLRFLHSDIIVLIRGPHLLFHYGLPWQPHCLVDCFDWLCWINWYWTKFSSLKYSKYNGFIVSLPLYASNLRKFGIIDSYLNFLAVSVLP